jgi:hypothetical protein
MTRTAVKASMCTGGPAERIPLNQEELEDSAQAPVDAQAADHQMDEVTKVISSTNLQVCAHHYKACEMIILSFYSTVACARMVAAFGSVTRPTVSVPSVGNVLRFLRRISNCLMIQTSNLPVSHVIGREEALPCGIL